MNQDFLSLTAAARILGVHWQTLQRWIDDGEGPRCFRKKNPRRDTIRILRKDLESFIDANSKGGVK